MKWKRLSLTEGTVERGYDHFIRRQQLVKHDENLDQQIAQHLLYCIYSIVFTPLHCIYFIVLYLLYCIASTPLYSINLIYCKLLCIYSIVLFCVYCIVLCLWYKSSHPSLWSKNLNISKLFTHNTSVSLKELFWLWNCTSIALITRNKCRE